MTKSEPREMIKQNSTQVNRYSCKDLITITPSVENDLIFARRLTAQALVEDDLPSALAYSAATAKLLPIVVKAGLHDHSLLRKEAIFCLAHDIMELVTSHSAKQLPATFPEIVDEICQDIATEIAQAST